jgi:hypothetical protein
MNNKMIEQNKSTVERERRAIEEAGRGSVMEGIGGCCVMILAVLGFIGLAPTLLASIAIIVAGCALLIGGESLATRITGIFGGNHYSFSQDIVGSGMGMESLAGILAAALGVLGLLGIYPVLVLGAAVIILGTALLPASLATAKLTGLPIGSFFGPDQTHSQEHGRYKARDMLHAASNSEALIGVGAIVLGILSLSGFAPMPLIMIALFAIGVSIMLAGWAMAGMMFESVAH